MAWTRLGLNCRFICSSCWNRLHSLVMTLLHYHLWYTDFQLPRLSRRARFAFTALFHRFTRTSFIRLASLPLHNRLYFLVSLTSDFGTVDFFLPQRCCHVCALRFYCVSIQLQTSRTSDDVLLSGGVKITKFVNAHYVTIVTLSLAKEDRY